MGSKHLAVEVEKAEIGEDEEEEPVSPTGQYFNSSALSVCILAVFESDVPIDDSQMFPLLDTLFLPINPRFSSIMVKDERGVQQWRRVKVNLADHVKVPVFPAGLSPLAYDELIDDYMSKVGTDRLPESRPLWELHMFKYPTSHGEGTVMFKLHHALGDGYSLLSALFSCVKRADDPSLPLTFPGNSTAAKTGGGGGGPGLVSLVMNSVRDFVWGLAKSTFLEDGVNPIRSGMEGIEFKPVEMSFATFSLDDIRRVKARIGGVAAQYIHSTLKNTSLSISNLIGPKEKMSLADHPVRSFHFMVVGVPQSLVITMVSYMGKLKVAMGTEKGFIDAKLLTTCTEKAFERIYEAALEEKP
ncbi:hypothetical protein QJS10_CPB20g01759 [Acorus calamus]|uniref:Diacylglycerol O-acyltransferase n=1 Tax=Acorus calamus TaxID=4465 RepID=A0AAV9CAB0_ACOCL|nr:hypothetical protein QJS10_CPB20g01759 [Acorus calamus]